MRLLLLIAIHSIFFLNIVTNEIIYTLNGKKALNIVSDKFLSFSIDSDILLNGLNTDIPIMEYLGPAYLRIATPLTDNLQFTGEESASNSNLTTFKFAPPIWKQLHDLFQRVNITPIFSISHKNTSDGKLTEEGSFLRQSHQSNIPYCILERNYELFGVSSVRYRNKAISVRHALDLLSNRRENSKIGEIMDDFADLTEAFVWQKAEDEMLELDKKSKFSNSSKIQMWMVTLKPEQSMTFKFAMNWAKVIGNTASLGYEILFWEERSYDFFRDTPAFWVTLFHKKLMGRTVLEIKSNRVSKLSIYCHCTKTQGNFYERGAITVFVVNDDIVKHNISLKLVGNFLKSIGVRSYVLTSDFQKSTTYLNNKKLNIRMLKDNVPLVPKLTKIQNKKYLMLNIPSTSIAFFVLSDIKIPACINNGDDDNLILKRNEKENIGFVDNLQSEIITRVQGSTSLLKELHMPTERASEIYGNAIYDAENILPKKFKEIDHNAVVKISHNGTVEVRTKKVKDFEEEEIKSMKLNEVSNINRYPSKLNRRQKREAKGGGRGRSGAHGGGKSKVIRILPKDKKKVNTSKRDINMVLLQEKSDEMSNKKNEKIETKKSYSQFSRKENYGAVTQPARFYKNQHISEERKLDIKKIVEDFHKRNNHGTKSKNNVQNLNENKTEDEKYFDLDYLDSNNYDDIFEETIENTRRIGNINKFVQNTKFPIRPTFRYKNLHAKSDTCGPKNMDNWLNTEITIDNNKNIEKAIKELEAYLNREKQHTEDTEIRNFSSVDYYDDYEDFSGPTRYKRDQNQQFTEKDILYYKQLMNSNIKYMRDNIRKQKLKNLSQKVVKPADLMKKVTQEKPVDNFPFKPVRYQMNEDLLKHKKSEVSAEDIDQRTNSPHFLRQKIIGNFKKIPKKTPKRFGGIHSINQKTNEIDKKMKEFVKTIQNELRTRVSRPNTRGGVMKEHVLKFPPNKRGWKKQHILPFSPKHYQSSLGYDGERKNINFLQNKRNLENVQEQLTDCHLYNEQRENYINRSKRYIDENTAQLSSGLNNNIHEILKDTDYLIPNFNRTRIFFITNLERPPYENFNNYKLENTSKYDTCPLIQNTEITQNNLKGLEVFEEVSRNPLSTKLTVSIENEIPKFEKLSKEVSHIQKISRNEEVNFLDKCFKIMSNFVNDMHDKIRAYLR